MTPKTSHFWIENCIRISAEIDTKNWPKHVTPKNDQKNDPDGASIINIDEEPYSINWEKELPVNEVMYLKYRQQYIKKEGSEELNTWQIFANHLKKWR